MTAADLYEIVKDVPRAAWPESMYSHKSKLWWKCSRSEHSFGDTRVSVHVVESAFIGSMTAWLASKCETVVYNREGTTKHTVSQGVTEWEGNSLVAALAAACKEAA